MNPEAWIALSALALSIIALAFIQNRNSNDTAARHAIVETKVAQQATEIQTLHAELTSLEHNQRERNDQLFKKFDGMVDAIGSIKSDVAYMRGEFDATTALKRILAESKT